MKLWRLLAVFFSCCIPGALPAQPKHEDRPLFEETIALVHDDDSAYCAGVWVGTRTILTANHCVADESPVLHVRDFAGKTFDASVAFTDPRRDLAALVVFNPPDHSTAQLAETWYTGEELTIIGHPAHVEWTLKHGWLSKAHSHPAPDNAGEMYMFYTQAPIWYGNSGGPAFDSSGRLVGICSMMSVSIPDLGFFVSLPEIRDFLTGR